MTADGIVMRLAAIALPPRLAAAVVVGAAVASVVGRALHSNLTWRRAGER